MSLDFYSESDANAHPNRTEAAIGALVWYFLPTVVTVPPLGLPANALLIRLLLGKPGICSTSEIFTLNLALFDLLFCLMFLIEYTVFLFNQTAQAAKFLAWGLSLAGGPMLLSILGLDSYLAVCHPLVFLRLKKPKLRLSVCLVVTAITIACCCLMKVSEHNWNVLIAILSTAIVIISFCNIMVLKSLHKSGPSRKIHPVKKRAFKLVLTAFVLVILHCVPPVIEHKLRLYGPDYLRPVSVITGLTYGILSWGSVTKPLSYLVRTKQLPLRAA